MTQETESIGPLPLSIVRRRGIENHVKSPRNRDQPPLYGPFSRELGLRTGVVGPALQKGGLGPDVNVTLVACDARELAIESGGNQRLVG